MPNRKLSHHRLDILKVICTLEFSKKSKCQFAFYRANIYYMHQRVIFFKVFYIKTVVIQSILCSELSSVVPPTPHQLPNLYLPKSSESHCIWKQGLCRCKELNINMKSYWIRVCPKSNNRCHYKERGQRYMQKQKRHKGLVKTESEIRVMQL